MSSWDPLDGVLQGEAYDKAMDSLARSQRNVLLDGVRRKRAEDKVYQRTVAEGPQAAQRREPRGFWRSLLYWTLLILGWTCELTGLVYLYMGKGLKWLAEKVS